MTWEKLDLQQKRDVQRFANLIGTEYSGQERTKEFIEIALRFIDLIGILTAIDCNSCDEEFNLLHAKFYEDNKEIIIKMYCPKCKHKIKLYLEGKGKWIKK